MLSSLQIENVAVIQKANVHFEKGLNVLTGETGAGKSILIDSINAILGNRTCHAAQTRGAGNGQSSGLHLMMFRLQCWTAWKRRGMSAQKR